MVVYDRELNYLSESKLPGGLMYFGGIPTAQGLYLPKTTENEDQLLLMEVAAIDCAE